MRAINFSTTAAIASTALTLYGNSDVYGADSINAPATLHELSILQQPKYASSVTEVFVRDALRNRLLDDKEYNLLADVFRSYNEQGAFASTNESLNRIAEINTLSFLIERAREGARTGLVLPDPEKRDLVSAMQKASETWFAGASIFLSPAASAALLADEKTGHNIKDFLTRDWILSPSANDLTERAKDASWRDAYKHQSQDLLQTLRESYSTFDDSRKIESRIDYLTRVALNAPMKSDLLAKLLGVHLPKSDEETYALIFSDPSYRKFVPFIEATKKFKNKTDGLDSSKDVETAAYALQGEALQPLREVLGTLTPRFHLELGISEQKSEHEAALLTAEQLSHYVRQGMLANELIEQVIRPFNPVLASRLGEFGAGAIKLEEGLARLSLLTTGESPLEGIVDAATGIEKLTQSLFGMENTAERRQRELLQAINLVREDIHDLAMSVGFLRRELWESSYRVNERLDSVFTALAAVDEHLSEGFRGIEERLQGVNRKLSEVDYKIDWLGYDLHRGLSLQVSQWSADDRKAFDDAYFDVFVNNPKVNGVPVPLRDEQKAKYAGVFARHATSVCKTPLLSGAVITFDDLVRERAWIRPTQYTFGFIPTLIGKDGLGLSLALDRDVPNPMDFMAAANAYLKFRNQNLAYSDNPQLLEEMIKNSEKIDKAADVISNPEVLQRAYDHYEKKMTALRDAIIAQVDQVTKTPHAINQGEFRWWENRRGVLEALKGSEADARFGFEQEIRVDTRGNVAKLPVDIDPKIIPSDVQVAVALGIAKLESQLVFSGRNFDPMYRDRRVAIDAREYENNVAYYRAEQDARSGKISWGAYRKIAVEWEHKNKSVYDDRRELNRAMPPTRHTITLDIRVKFDRRYLSNGEPVVAVCKRVLSSDGSQWKGGLDATVVQWRNYYRLKVEPDTLLSILSPIGSGGPYLPEIAAWWLAKYDEWKKVYKMDSYDKSWLVGHGITKIDGLEIDDWSMAKIGNPRRSLRTMFNEFSSIENSSSPEADLCAQRVIRNYISAEQGKVTPRVYEHFHKSEDVLEPSIAAAIAAAESLYYVSRIGWGDRVDIDAARIYRREDILKTLLAGGREENPAELCKRLHEIEQRLEKTRAEITKAKALPLKSEIVPGLSALQQRLYAAYAAAQEEEIHEMKSLPAKVEKKSSDVQPGGQTKRE